MLLKKPHSTAYKPDTGTQSSLCKNISGQAKDKTSVHQFFSAPKST